MIVLAFAAWFVIDAGALIAMVLLPLTVAAVIGSVAVSVIRGWLGDRSAARGVDRRSFSARAISGSNLPPGLPVSLKRAARRQPRMPPMYSVAELMPGRRGPDCRL